MIFFCLAAAFAPVSDTRPPRKSHRQFEFASSTPLTAAWVEATPDSEIWLGKRTGSLTFVP
jgi:hypothetical protein